MAIARLARPRRTSTLTPRQQHVAQLIGEGLTNRQIGERLGISERTVDQHVHDVLVRLDKVSRQEIVAVVEMATAFRISLAELLQALAA
jgi:DNA-binding NarL/FixJ family response regulator